MKKKDLFILVADVRQEQVLRTLLDERRAALQLQPLTYTIIRHPRRDAGVFREAPAFLRRYESDHRYALVVFDSAFRHDPALSPADLKGQLSQRISGEAWEDLPGVILIEPELEAWVWSRSKHMERVIGRSYSEARRLGAQRSWWAEESMKPSHPKELFETLMQQTMKRKPLAVDCIALARKTSVRECADPSFCELRETLRRWFGS